MIAPSAAMIETAKDQLDDENYREAHAWLWPDQNKELETSFPIYATSENFVYGYELGLQTARVLLATMPEAIENKVEI